MRFADAVREATGRAVRGFERVGGGDINDAFRVQFEDESFAFVKTRADAAPGEYEAEAAGLRWLAEPGALRVPEVLGVSDTVLVLDWVDEGRRGDPAAFGAGLAVVHAAGADAFGGEKPLRIGPLELPNGPAAD
ncbi:MAG TPA: fructosamine kinase family protein, partial [Solirubrobacter sp.]|nr:fructosamine kinase family protein [Solirubrobacter sp.]